MSESEVDYSWRCKKCGESGFNCSDKIWKFCPYCGSQELEIKVEDDGKET